MKVYSLAVLTSHPIQYQAPLWRRLAQHLQIDLTVYFCSDYGVTEKVDPGFGVKFKWDIPLLKGYRYKFLRSFKEPTLNGFFGLRNWEIVKELIINKHDAIYVHGYSYFTNWLAFTGAWLTGTPILLRTISHLIDPRPLHVNAIKEIILRLSFHRFKGCLYIGTHNWNFYRHFGVPKTHLFFTPHVVDNDYFQMQAESLSLKRNEIRARWGIDDRPVILFVGKLIPKKQPLLLLEAYHRVRQDYPCALFYVGDGPLRSIIETRIKREDISDVRITGFLNQSEISKAYIAGDILVLPSSERETWGLVVNEGMNFGLPVIVSDRVGCAPDLVKDGENGYVVPCNSSFVLAESLRKLIVDSGRRHAFGKRSLEIIKNWGLNQFVEGVVRALRRVERTR